MGCSVALLLARCGWRVTIFDQAVEPFAGASGWNEGKIHLGYLYAADPTLATARHLLPGGLAFRDTVEQILGHSIAPAMTADDDLYLLHRQSIVTPLAMTAYFSRLAALIRDMPGAGRYPHDAARRAPEALHPDEVARLAPGGQILAGFRVPERSYSTRWIAQHYLAALAAEPGITLRMGERVHDVRPKEPEEWSGPFRIGLDRGSEGPFSHVVNALWEGRGLVDQRLGLPADPDLSHRYRLSLFVRTCRPVSVGSQIIAVGPFGDLKRYGERDFYLSWYLAGLMAEGHAVAPPPLPPWNQAERQRDIFAALAEILPAVGAIRDAAEHVELRGGWVFARSRGALSDPAATIHRRDRFGVAWNGRYISVDTGKYATAPWLARHLADQMTAG